MVLMDIKLKVFDLAGSPSFLPAHHLFLSKDGLYQAVFNMSDYALSKSSLSIAQLGTLELWLQIIYSQVPSSHVVIVATHSDDPRINDELRTHIREDVEMMLAKYRKTHRRQFEGESVPQCVLCEGRHLCDVSASTFYVRGSSNAGVLGPGPCGRGDSPSPCIPHVVGYYEVSGKEQFPKTFRSSKNVSMQKMKVGLGTSAQVLLSSKVGARVPQKCLYVRDRVKEMREGEADLKKRPIIDLNRLRVIAHGCGIKDDFKIKDLIRYFHSQGEFLWFEDSFSLSELVFIDPSWMSDQLRPFLAAPPGLVTDGILRVHALEKIWPGTSEGDRWFLLALLRKLGICFPLSDTEDLVPSRLPIGRPERDTWPLCPSAPARQISCEFKLSFLPPALFSELIAAVNTRNLPSAVDPKPLYFRHHMVFSTNTKASQGCPLHFTRVGSLEEEHSSWGPHRVFMEVTPEENTLRVSIRGQAPCCVLPDIITAIKSVMDPRYPGVKYIRYFVCPGCEMRGEKFPACIGELQEEGNHACPKGHELGTREDILAGNLPPFAPSPSKAVIDESKHVTGKRASNLLKDSCCPRLLAVFPIGFQSAPLNNCLSVLSSLKEGYAVHFLCECPGYWHLVKSPGYRVPRPKEFFHMYGARVCKLLKAKFMLRDDHALTLSPQSPTKIIFGDVTQNAVIVQDVQCLLEHYFLQFPELRATCTSFLQEDLDYLQSHEDLSRGKLCQALEISPEWGRLGPLVCTYHVRADRYLWLCDKHAQ